MTDDAYHDYMRMLALERDATQDRLRWWISNAIECGRSFEASVCEAAEYYDRVDEVREKFPGMYEAFEAKGAASMADFEAKHCAVEVRKRQEQQAWEESVRQSRLSAMSREKQVLASRGVAV